ncbi:AbrB/MazE/SpoVT family DNA-binding domain-containing protein [Candidatus Aerophobetes bacterium]|nr:AbrB/MazE/SpoVT family DNA-binding domain-containing protein [Candidatus Aerophobetes bacterium]
MPIVKIGPKHQVTIPKEVFDTLHLKPGDILEVASQAGKIVMIPQQLSARAPAPSLTQKEQQILIEAKRKIKQIQSDILTSQGLTHEEVRVASHVGLIDPHQAWWWSEEWQKREREAEKDMQEGKLKTFSTIEDLVKDLQS